MIFKLYLVRHGQSIYNLENKFTGWKDVDLTKQGTKQAVDCGTLLKDIKFDLCYTSNLKRAINTLNIILEKIIILKKLILKPITFQF